jgi:class 3 adenylate cyclase
MFNLYKSRRQVIADAIAALARYGVASNLQEKLTAVFDEQPDRELYRTNPRLLAAHLQIPERQILQILVAALREGIVALNWEVECPACGGIDPAHQHLNELRSLHTCPACKTIHKTDADDNVRVTVTLDARLRKLKDTADDLPFRQRMDRRYGPVSAHRLLTLPTFRQLFPKETLPPNESLLIRRVAILFTDLAGSTQLYSRRGDTKAYELVHSHFDLLFRIVDDQGGTVVKTIGDAVMAAFTDPHAALQAAIAMHHQLHALNQSLALPPTDWLRLKIGINAGPCVSVTLNDRLDYFGSTVNTAARVQSVSHADGITVTEELRQDPATQAELNRWPTQPRILQLKGIDHPVAVLDLSPLTAPGLPAAIAKPVL